MKKFDFVKKNNLKISQIYMDGKEATVLCADARDIRDWAMVVHINIPFDDDKGKHELVIIKVLKDKAYIHLRHLQYKNYSRLSPRLDKDDIFYIKHIGNIFEFFITRSYRVKFAHDFITASDDNAKILYHMYHSIDPESQMIDYLGKHPADHEILKRRNIETRQRSGSDPIFTKINIKKKRDRTIVAI